MTQLIADAEKKLGGEAWVLGKQGGPSTTDWGQMKKDLADEYDAKYIEQWRKFVANTKFVGYTNLPDATDKLGVISANTSPLLQLFAVISTNTNVDDRVRTAFRPASIVVPPDSPVLVTDKTQNYMTELSKLMLTIQNLIGKPPDPSLFGPVDAEASSASLARNQISLNFPPDRDAHVDTALSNLLQDPITKAQELGKGIGTAGLNGAGKQFCMASAFGKFPFNGRSSTDASLQEVNEIFRPKEGTLWKFYEASLKQYLTCTQSGCAVVAGAPLTPQFVTFMSDAVRFSKALYGDAGTDPALKYTVQPKSDQVDTFTFTVDGNKTALKSGQQGQFAWSGASNKFGLTIQLAGGGSSVGATPFEGLWAPLRFFYNADRTSPSGAAYVFIFTPREGKQARPLADANGKPLEYQVMVDTHGGPAIFNANYWQQLKCVATVAK